MNEYVEKCIGKVIISCQAYEDTPLYGANYMKKMAECALIGGAQAIRACWPQDIKAIRELGDFPIIGLNKVIIDGKNENEYIIITPTFESAAQVIDAGCNIIALDCSIRPFRGKEELKALLKQIKEKYPHIAIMADCMTLDDGIFAAESGYVDIVSTTLSGMVNNIDGPDVELVKELKKRIKLPINAEGRVWDIKDLEAVLAAGADMVTIGTAITRPHLISKRFIDFNNKYREVEHNR